MSSKFVLFLFLTQILFLSSCLTEDPATKKLIKPTTAQWELTMIISGGIQAKEEKISIQNDGTLLVEDLIQSTKNQVKVGNQQNLEYIYSRLKTITKIEIIDHKTNDTFKFNSRCNDCQSTLISFKFDNKNYSVSKSIKSDGKSVFTELKNKILEIQNNNLNKKGLENL